MGGERVCRWNRLIRLNANELNDPAVASLQSNRLAHIFTRNTKSRYRSSRSANAPSTALLYTPSFPTHTSQFTPVSGSYSLIKGTRACAIRFTSVNPRYRSSPATFDSNCTFLLLNPRGGWCRRFPPRDPRLPAVPISLASYHGEFGSTSKLRSMSDPAVWNTETYDPNGAHDTPGNFLSSICEKRARRFWRFWSSRGVVRCWRTMRRSSPSRRAMFSALGARPSRISAPSAASRIERASARSSAGDGHSRRSDSSSESKSSSSSSRASSKRETSPWSGSVSCSSP